jgi:UDP-N-acetylmuramate--alanine ligase
VLVAFQPHRYTRTQLLREEFADCFRDADLVLVTDIYAASETPIPGVSGASIVDAIRARHPESKAEFVPKDEIREYLLRQVRRGDIVVTLGAGDITKISDELAAAFSLRSA